MSEIDSLSRRRQEIWAGAPHEPGEADHIARRLEELYEERRARAAGGADRDEISRRARTESELSRLAGR